MKNIYILLFFTFSFSFNIHAQTIACNEICILGITLDTISNELNVTVFNGANGSQINYPVVVVTDNTGDTIGNINNQFFLFAHLPNDTSIHSIPTALNTFATSFTGTVYIKDTPTSAKCTFSYPMTCTVGINEYAQTNFSLFPNPATDNVTIDISNFNTKKANITIYDITGKQLQNFETVNSKTIVNTENLKAGIYFVAVIVDNNNVFTRKLVIE